jgi:anti-anti-sigma factor
VVFDMAGVTFMDSSGLQVLAFMSRRVSTDGSLTIRNPSPIVNRLLQLAGMNCAMRIEPSMETPLAG